MTSISDGLSLQRSTVLDPVPGFHSADEANDASLYGDNHDSNDQYQARRVVAGSFGRIWLWFLIGCVGITVAPLLIGWSSYLIETGSMKPSIKPGDVVITSPNPSVDQLGGRVITFDSPSVPGRVVTHRVVEIDEAGVMRTRGDANATADSATITIDDVRGMGRLLVRYVGLPKVWMQEGNFLPLAGFVLTIVIAGAAVRWDHEPETDEEEVGPDNDGPPIPPPAAEGAVGAAAVGAFARLRHSPSLVVFILLALAYIAALAVPSALAAISSTTRTAANTWSVPTFNYTTELQNIDPWVYYKLDDSSGNNVVDSSGNGRTGTYNSTFTKGVDGAFETNTPDRAVTLTNANSCIYMPNASKITPAPTVYSSTAWIKTTAGYNQGGKILGFESTRTGVSNTDNGGQFDRHVYMDGAGYVRFGVWLGYSFTLRSLAPLNDGEWHLIATTMGPGGMSLYVDGELASTSTNTASEIFTNGGWWRFGCGNLNAWSSTSGTDIAWSGANVPNGQANYAFRGSMDEVAIWNNVQLTPSQLAFMYFTR